MNGCILAHGYNQYFLKNIDDTEMLSEAFGLQIKRFVERCSGSNLANSSEGVSDGRSDTSDLEARIRQLESEVFKQGLPESRKLEQGS